MSPQHVVPEMCFERGGLDASGSVITIVSGNDSNIAHVSKMEITFFFMTFFSFLEIDFIINFFDKKLITVN